MEESPEQVGYDEVALLIDERLIQVRGHLFKYDADTDSNKLVAPNSFLCVDRMQGPSRFHYMFHVTDQAQRLSFTRVEVETPMLNYSFSEKERILMWIGKLPENATLESEVPAWSFKIEEESQVPTLKGVLTKVIFETNMKEEIERACDKDDDKYLESQVVGETKSEVPSQELYKIEDFEFMDFELTRTPERRAESSDEEEEASKKQNKLDLGLFDDSELQNSEAVQAQNYDLTFVASGPVVKVYKNAQDHPSLEHHMNLPVLKNEFDEVIKPMHLMLHNGESQLIFTDSRNNNKITLFDLNKGQIVETFQASKDKSLDEIRHLTSKVKNGQRDAESTFVGINDRAIFTIDPRLDKQERAAVSKVYKTNPSFNRVATTLQGGLAIGSLSGEIRLYKEVGQNAKTLLPGLGDPIRSVDMTIDGKWVLATTQTYLLLISTECESGKTGFE